MKKTSIFCLFIVISLQLTSCKKSYNEDEVNKTITEFLEAMKKPVDFKKMKESYVDFSFHSVPSVSKYEIKSLNKENGVVIAKIATTYKKRARVSTVDFTLKLTKIDGVWKITNSKGMPNIKLVYPKAYKYALENNLFKISDSLWDMELNSVIQDARSKIEEFNTIQKSLQEMVDKNAKANELVKKSDATAEKAKKAFDKFDNKN